MENKIVTAIFKDSTHTKVSDVWQWDYGQILRIQGLDLPTAVEVDFAVAGASESIARIGTTKDGVTDVVIPDSLIETGKNLVAYIYLRDSASGNTEYQIDMLVTKRAKPEAYDTPEDKELFGQAIEAVNAAADRAEKAGQTAQEAAQKAGLDAEQTAQDRVEVAKMVETVTDISEQVKKVEQLSQQAQDAADKTEADAQQTAEDRVEVGKMLETVKDVSEQVKSVEESVQKAKESEQAAAGHRTAVEKMKNSVEQTASTFPQTVQSGIQSVENAGTAEVHEITQAGAAQKTAVEAAGTQAVESVENVQQVATEAVETAKTEAVQAVQAEGAKQIKEVQDKGAEVLQSIPEDFATQMETKLDKQQGIENKGKVLVIGEDGNVVPEEVASGGGDGIAIINTMSGESPLVIPDSAERVNKGFGLTGKTEQVTTTGKNLFDPNNNYEDLVWIGNDGEIVAGSSARTSDYIPVEQGNYAFQFDVINNNQMFVAGYNTDKQFVEIVGTISRGKCIIKIDNIEIETIRLSYTRESTRIQLERSETQTPYEPYTGGKPSPNPEYPQEIVNSGKLNADTQKYEVSGKMLSKNLLNLKNPSVKFERCTLQEDGSVKSAITSNYYFCSIYVDDPYVVGNIKNGQTISFSIDKGISNKTITISLHGDREGSVNYQEKSSASGGNSVSIVPSGFKKVSKIELRFNRSGSLFTDTETVVRDFMICFGEPTVYVPYAEQSFTLTSDRPITKWDKLVEQGGQIGWLYKSRIAEIPKTGYALKNTNENRYGVYFSKSSIFKDGVVTKGSPEKDSNIFTHFKPGNPYASNGNIAWLYVAGGNTDLRIKVDDETINTVELFEQYISDKDIQILYETESTEFIPLPQSEQNAIRALKTYYPTTVITADGGELDPDIEVTYTADTKNYIDGKVSANVASIISQYQLNTANLLSLMPMETQATMIENDTNNILGDMEVQKHE